MKEIIGFLLLTFVCPFCQEIWSQINPGTDNLAHQYTFNDGTANDVIATNPAHGSLMGGAHIENNALKLDADGQYLSFSGEVLALNSFSVVSQEIWYTPVSGANTGYTMLSYFGNTNSSDGLGYNYISTSSARGDNVSRTAISDGSWSNEVKANGPEYDDGLLHHMVSVISADSVILYIDGLLVDKTANTKPLSTINTSYAYLGKGGYTNDPTWIGSISKFSIYNKSLSSEEVLYLYQQGPESSPMITSSKKHLSFDDRFATDVFYVSGINLVDTITVASPAGITVSPVKLAPDASNAELNVTYNTSTIVDGYITLTSGSEVVNIHVKSYTNDCYSPLFPDLHNLVPDPFVSDLSNFSGWGTYSINTDSAFVYCGATSGMVTGTNSGSLDVSLTGNIETNTQYRVKAKVYLVGGKFQIGISGWYLGKGDYIKSYSITDSWQDVDFTFTTGGAIGSEPELFFNNYGLTGKTGYIDNLEMYAVPKVYTSSDALLFLTAGTQDVSVRGVNLLQDISITVPEGFTLSTTTLPADSDGEQLTVTYTGTETTSGYIYFTSGNVKDSLHVSGSKEPLLISSVPTMVLDEIDTIAQFTLTGYNLTENVTLVAPEGITLTSLSLPFGFNDTTISVSYDGQSVTSGYITANSGVAKDSIQLFAEPNENCFDSLFSIDDNLIVDPTCNYYLEDGWGDKSINTDPDFVYCGARSGKVKDNGSFDRKLTGTLKPNTSYRMRAKVYKVGTASGNPGNVTYTLAMDSAANPGKYQLIKIAMDSACMYYSKYTPFIENIYVYYSAGIPTAQASYRGSIGFGSNTRYMWVGTAIHEMAHYFGSGTTYTWKGLMVGGLWQGTAGKALCKELTGGPLKGDNNSSPVHYWPYGINQKEEITNLGSLAVQEKALTDAVRIIKAMLVDDCGLPTNNAPVGLGVYGWDATKDNIYHEVVTTNSWQDVDFIFKTGATLKESQGVYFNYGTGYIDNWELYELSSDATLTDLKVSGTTVTGFNAAILSYDVELPYGTTNVPDVVGIANHTYAKAVVTDAGSLPGSTTVEVTAQDSTYKLTYTVRFLVDTETGLSEAKDQSVSIYPTISDQSFTVKTSGTPTIIKVYGANGNLIIRQTVNSLEQKLILPEAGMYIVHVECNEETRTFKIFKTD